MNKLYKTSKPIWILLILVHIQTFLLAQNNNNQQFSVTGTIVDEQNNPVPFANTVLYRNQDSTLVTGAVSDEKGQFNIRVGKGNYYLKITFLSYEEKVIPKINIVSQDINVGKVLLKASSEQLNEVIVRGEKSQMELQLDKRVFNIGTDLSNIGGNAAEILDNVPSVAVDVEGNVSLRGSQNVRILIDGKPSGLAGISNPDALRQLQGNMIDRIEVITNPSSRYDAEGEVGIINIVLKKSVKQGINGSFTVNVGYPANYGGAFNLNYRKSKMNLFASYGINYRENPGYGSSFQRFTGNDSVFSYRENSKRTRGGISNNLRFGMDYFLNQGNTITGAILYQRADGRNTSRFEYQDFDQQDQLVRTVLRQEKEEEPENNIEASLTYSKQFTQKGRSFTADFKWIETDEIERSNYTQTDLSVNEAIRQRSNNTEDERNILLQADYIHPFSEKGKFEAGIKSSNRLLQNKYKVEQQSDEINWFVLPGLQNNLIYTENIHAAYLMAGNQFRKFSIQAGLRGELSDITVDLPEVNEVNNRLYFNLFPSAHLSYEINKSKALQLSYSYRLSRPGFRDLLPFSGLSDSRSLAVGNPRLNPEYTHSLEAGYLLNGENWSVLSSVYYRYRTGVIQRITVVDSALVDTAIFSRIVPVNLSTQNAYGLEFNVSYSLQNWWRLNASFNFYRAITSGSYREQELYSDTYTWTSRATSKMTFFKTWNFQAGINYRAPQQTTQGRELSMYAIDLGLARDVLKGNGTLTLSVRDLLNTRKRRTIIEEEGYYANSMFQWSARQISLTFNYRLNQRNDNRNRDVIDSSEDGDM